MFRWYDPLFVREPCPVRFWKVGFLMSWQTAQGQILSSLGSSMAKNHDKEKDPGFIPATQPAHPPAIDLLADLNRSGQAKEFGLKFHWFTSMPLVRLNSQGAKAVP